MPLYNDHFRRRQRNQAELAVYEDYVAAQLPATRPTREDSTQSVDVHMTHETQYAGTVEETGRVDVSVTWSPKSVLLQTRMQTDMPQVRISPSSHAYVELPIRPKLTSGVFQADFNQDGFQDVLAVLYKPRKSEVIIKGGVLMLSTALDEFNLGQAMLAEGL